MKFLTLSFLILYSCSSNTSSDTIDRSLGKWSVDTGVLDQETQDQESEPDWTYSGVPLYEIRVLTFNARRYFDDICDTEKCGPNDYEVQLSRSEFEKRGLEIANRILELDADVVVFQELEKQTCLEEILKHLEMDGVAFGETNEPASLDVAITSKYPIVFTHGHRKTFDLQLLPAGTTKFARDFLEAHFSIGEQKLVVFGAHFISKRNGNHPWREAEARGAREIMLRTSTSNPDTLVVLGGDLNDVVSSVPVQTIVEGDHYRAAENDESWTYEYSGFEMQLDHLIYSHSPAVELVEVIAFNEPDDFEISDHALLMGTFRVYEK